MQADRYKLNDLGQAELDALRAAGVALTDDDVVRINALAADVTDPDTRRALSRGRPIHCGGVWFWPWTAAAAQWFQDVGSDMPDPNAALAYSQAYGYSSLLYRADWPEVRRWRGTLRCRPRELAMVVAEIIAQEEETEIPQRASDGTATVGDLSAAMMAMAGGTVEMWEQQVSIGYVRAVLNTLAAQAKAAGSGGVSPAVARATMALGMECERIKERGRANG